METIEVEYDEGCHTWRPDAEYNRYFLEAQQNYFNHRLTAYGHVFLNEVFDALGFQRTTKGAVCGWLKDDTVFFGMLPEANFGEAVTLKFDVEVIYEKIEEDI